MDVHGYSVCDFIPCMVCGSQAVDVHHINGRIGRLRNDPTNLIALCRKCHIRAHNYELSKEFLTNKLKSNEGKNSD